METGSSRSMMVWGMMIEALPMDSAASGIPRTKELNPTNTFSSSRALMILAPWAVTLCPWRRELMMKQFSWALEPLPRTESSM